MRIQHLIDGRTVEGRDYFETVNPATQEVLAEVARGGASEVQAAVAAAKAAFPKWAGTAPAERARLMRRLGELITADVPALSETETRDTGQVIGQTRKQLVPRAADNFHYFAEMCVRVDGHTYPTPTHLNYTLFHPVGVCALISPWNVPFMTATWKVAPALAFGNTAVLKMSELSPLTAARLGELALEAGIPAGVLNVVHGYGGEAGEALVSHAGPFNLENMYAATEELWFPEWEYGGPFWDPKAMREQYRVYSPHLYAGKFRTPTLVTHGELDYRVPYSEGLSMFTSLQRQGIPSRLVVFPDEGHWIGKPQNQRLWWNEVQGWLSKYLAGKTAS